MPEGMALLAAALPLLGGTIAKFGKITLPRPAVAAVMSAALVLSAMAISSDPLGGTMMAIYSGVASLILLAAPKRDRDPHAQAEGLWIAGGTLAAYASGNLLLILGGWMLSALPLWKRPVNRRESWALPRSVASAGTIALALAILSFSWQAWNGGAADPFSVAALRGLRGLDNRWIFGLLIAAVVARKSVVPLHSPFLGVLEQGNGLNALLYMNGHLGVYLVLRVILPLLPSTSGEALGPLADVALLSAACAALMGLTEKSPRRLLGLISISQVSFLLAGLEGGSQEGLSGALICLLAFSCSTTPMFLILRLLEVRTDSGLLLDRFHGLATRAPRLAAVFLLSALALVGLPGTLGFAAEDLLFHSTLELHPELGLVLPLATALNAISLLRMFAMIFFGRRDVHVVPIQDASVLERLALSAAAVLIVCAGLFPSLPLGLMQQVATTIAP